MKKLKILIWLVVLYSGAITIAQNIVFSGSRISILGPATITEPGEYILGRDINGLVIIEANNVVFDLNNHVISGTSRGIEAENVENVTIQNGSIKTMNDSAIAFENSQNIVLKNLFIDQPGSASGIFISTCSRIQLDAIQVQRAAVVGTFCLNVSEVVVSRSIFKDNGGRGLLFNIADQVFIHNSIFLSNGGDGLDLVDTQSSIIQSCISQDNVDRGIDMTNCFNISLQENQAHNNITDGIRLLDTNNCCLQRNIANNNGQFGIHNQTGINNSFFTNKAQLNTMDNFFDVPLVAEFDLSMGDFIVSPTIVFSNVSIIS